MKRIIAITISIVLVFTTVAFAGSARNKKVNANLLKLDFDGAECNCYARLVYAGKDIKATLKLYEDDELVDSWKESGTNRVVLKGSHKGKSGKTYTLKVSGKAGDKKLDVTPVKKAYESNYPEVKIKRGKLRSLTSDSPSFTAEWKKLTNAKKYQLAYRVKGTKKWTKVTTDKHNCTIKGKAATEYDVKVRGKGSSGYGKWSAIMTVRTKLKRPVVTLKQSGNLITVSWKKIAKAKKYKLAYRKKGNSKWETIETNLCHSNVGGDPRTEYQFKVRAIRSKSVKSKWSKIKTIELKSTGDRPADLSASMVGDIFGGYDDTTNRYTEVYFGESDLPVTEIPEAEETVKVYKAIHNDPSLKELKAFEEKYHAALVSISGIENDNVDYDVYENSGSAYYDGFDNIMYFGQAFESDDEGNEYSTIGADASYNRFTVYAANDRIKFNKKYLSIGASDSDKEIAKKTEKIKDQYNKLFDVSFDDMMVERYFGYDGLEDIVIYLYDAEDSDIPSFVTLPGYIHRKPMTAKYIKLQFTADQGPGTGADWGETKDKAFLTRVEYSESIMNDKEFYREYDRESGAYSMLTLKDAEKLLAKGYVFGGHSCPLCMANQSEIDFSEYDAVSFEYVAGNNRMIVPFYTFYKKLGIENGVYKYAKTYVCAAELPDTEKYFKEQEKYHHTDE